MELCVCMNEVVQVFLCFLLDIGDVGDVGILTRERIRSTYT